MRGMLVQKNLRKLDEQVGLQTDPPQRRLRQRTARGLGFSRRVFSHQGDRPGNYVFVRMEFDLTGKRIWRRLLRCREMSLQRVLAEADSEE